MTKKSTDANTPRLIFNQNQIVFDGYNPYDCLKEVDETVELVKPIKLLLVDRDGVININSPFENSRYYYILNKADVIIKDDVPEALNKMKAVNIPIYLVTKQRCIGKGLIKEEEVIDINNHISKLMDFSFDKIFIEKDKPTKSDLIHKIISDVNIHPSEIYFIDDSKEECEAASTLGITAINSGNLERVVREFFVKRHDRYKHRMKNPLHGGKMINLTGFRFGILTVQNPKRVLSTGISWECLCDCGNMITLSTSQLRKRKFASCGCKHYSKGQNVYNYTGYKDITGTRWNSVVEGARSRNLEFAITKRIVWDIFEKQKRKCALTGIEVSFSDNSASIDRIDSSIGYLIENTQILHKDVNLMKMNLSQEYFISLCKKIANHK